ncbi:MAG: M48 family metallopeptidase [bacterium]|nr:M48 family metallopeptidase [bacterium]
MTGPLQTTLLAGRPVRYRVRRSPRARRIGVQVSAREGVVVVLPRRVALREVEATLREFAAWVDEQVDVHGVREGPLCSELTTGSPLLVMGARRRLELAALPAGRVRPRFTIEDERLLCELPSDRLLDPRPAVERWLRRLARQEIPPRVDHWAGELDLHPRRVIIGERTSRWGSCSSRGTLSFCYRLVMAPPRVVDAIVAHEVCHLAHLNHSKRFWSLLDAACPWHREAEEWLKEHHEAMIL